MPFYVEERGIIYMWKKHHTYKNLTELFLKKMNYVIVQ